MIFYVGGRVVGLKVMIQMYVLKRNLIHGRQFLKAWMTMYHDSLRCLPYTVRGSQPAEHVWFVHSTHVPCVIAHKMFICNWKEDSGTYVRLASDMNGLHLIMMKTYLNHKTHQIIHKYLVNVIIKFNVILQQILYSFIKRNII